MRPDSVARWLCLLLAGVVTEGCVIVPYKPQADVVNNRDVALDPSSTIVTSGPRRQLDDLAEAIKNVDKAITIVAAQEFLDVAFLDSDITLSRALDPATCARAYDKLGTEYLVLAGTVTQSKGDKRGAMVAAIGFYGAGSQTEHVTALATVIDLRHAQPLAAVNSHAEGTMVGVGAFYGLFVVPMTGTSAREGLARGIVSAMREHSGPGALRIAVLAAEAGPPPAAQAKSAGDHRSSDNE